MEKRFERAMREGITFNTTIGLLTTEDMWRIPLRSNDKLNLDEITSAVDEEIQKSSKKSFVDKQTNADEILELKMDILKYIIDVKLKEEEEKKNANLKKEKRKRLLALRAAKQNDLDSNKSLEEIDAELAEL